ncbi:MAG: response regulator transcription factor [Verrucomicrobia bacterium]|nr:MAG: response regulator transcription factor [Verrucomicrobiota bacterium]
MTEGRIQIAIIEDELLLAETLAAWVARHAEFQLVGCAADGDAGWELCVAKRPDLALVDIEMPKLNGLELIERLLASFPKIRLIVMSGLMDPYTIWRVMQTGVPGYFYKTGSPSTLMQAIKTVVQGGTYFSPIFAQVKAEWLAQPEAFQKVLSDREQDILRRVVSGQDDEVISAQLGITAATVATHRKHIRQKLGLHNDREFIAYAQRWGLSPSHH